jgi:predicted glutamine amidotransferase
VPPPPKLPLLLGAPLEPPPAFELLEGSPEENPPRAVLLLEHDVKSVAVEAAVASAETKRVGKGRWNFMAHIATVKRRTMLRIFACQQCYGISPTERYNMCRLLAIASSEPTDFRMVLRDAPRSLSNLSKEHPHGWGLAVFGERAGWQLERNILSAHEDDRFQELAAGFRGEVLVAHVRLRTVGRTALENTHPFRRDGWVFAHNGTIARLDALDLRISPLRRAELEGETDSERLFAAFLTRFDALGLHACCSGDALDDAVREIAADFRSIEGLGACNFVLSNGVVTYAHRFGRSLFVLTRGKDDPVRRIRTSIPSTVSSPSSPLLTVLETPWSARRRAVFVASEALTDEPWQELEEGSLICLDRRSLPEPRTI